MSRYTEMYRALGMLRSRSHLEVNRVAEVHAAIIRALQDELGVSAETRAISSEPRAPVTNDVYARTPDQAAVYTNVITVVLRDEGGAPGGAHATFTFTMKYSVGPYEAADDQAARTVPVVVRISTHARDIAVADDQGAREAAIAIVSACEYYLGRCAEADGRPATVDVDRA